ncbi:MAG: four helix bundle protein [Bacteroidetes bacterium]|nr:four helix bundle protein [Bacteroidota bacterium]
MEKFEPIFDYEDRLVRFAGESALFVEKLTNNYAVTYYKNQFIRSSGSPVLNYGEAQATVTDNDFIHKMSIVLKELKESRSCLKVLAYLKVGNEQMRRMLLRECEELIAIGFSMIKKRR